MNKSVHHLFRGLVVTGALLAISAANNNDSSMIISQQLTGTNADVLPSKSNSAFREGEVLTYKLHYGVINAGVAVLEVKPELINVNGRKV